MAERGHLVVVLPGIGGTRLAVPDAAGNATDKIVWDAGLRDVGLLRHPERLSLDEHEHLAPAGLLKTRTAFGFWTVVPGYDGLLRRLGARDGAVLDDGTSPRPVPKANVVAVGYDFRLGIEPAAQRLDDEVRARLEDLWPGQDHEDRVLIVAHSMGGLVARYWIAQSSGAAELCRGLITLGTPHRGAPKALEVMANGVPLPLHLGHITKPRDTLRKWPGMAELLPVYPAIEDETTGDLQYPHELDLPWMTGPAGKAYEVHQKIRQGWKELEIPPEVIPRIGYGHGTLRSCQWDGTRVRVGRQAPKDGELGGWEQDRGDGTVPCYSGMPLEMSKRTGLGLRVCERHGPIAELDEIETLLGWFDDDPSLHRFQAGEEHPAVLGVDIDELQLTEHPVDVTARIQVPDELAVDDPTAEAVWARLDGVGDSDVRLEWDSATLTYRGSLRPSAPGLHRVVVTAEDVAGGLSTEQWVEVIGDDDLG